MNYYKNRRSNLGIDENRLDQLFKYIVDAFSEEWLNKKPPHPLRQLWQRSDELSTNELFTLACGLETLIPIDKIWVRDQVKHIRGTDKANRQGAIFEIVGLNMLHNPRHPAKPAKANQAGYD